MARISRNGVREFTQTVGTTSFVLDGPLQQCNAFRDVLTDGQQCLYRCQANVGTEWEEGLGTYDATNNWLVRTEVYRSSNSDTLVPFSNGRKNVYIHENTEFVLRKATRTMTTGRSLKLNADGDVVVSAHAPPDATPVVTGSRGGNVALTNLLTALAAANIIVDSTTA